MAHSTELNSVLGTVKSLTEPYTYLYTNFDHVFRDVISSCALTDLVNSTIPKQNIHNALQSALESTANLALDTASETNDPRLRSISDQLWSPLIATLISVLFTRALPTPAKKSQSSPPIAKVRKPAEPVERIHVEVDKIVAIHEKLKSVALTRPRLYCNSSYIACEMDKCAFCSHMFHNVNLTQCKGHKPCNSSGWYPHVGKPLWIQLKSKHAAAIPCKLRPKECGPNELPALLATPVLQRSEESAGIRELEIAETSSRISESSVVSDTQSLPGHSSWSESVQSYVSKKRRFETTSAPASPAR